MKDKLLFFSPWTQNSEACEIREACFFLFESHNSEANERLNSHSNSASCFEHMHKIKKAVLATAKKKGTSEREERNSSIKSNRFDFIGGEKKTATFFSPFKNILFFFNFLKLWK